MIRHGSKELDRSSATERPSPVMLSAAKHLAADGDRPFVSLRVTRWDWSNGQGQFVQIEPCLSILQRQEDNCMLLSLHICNVYVTIFI